MFSNTRFPTNFLRLIKSKEKTPKSIPLIVKVSHTVSFVLQCLSKWEKVFPYYFSSYEIGKNHWRILWIWSQIRRCPSVSRIYPLDALFAWKVFLHLDTSKFWLHIQRSLQFSLEIGSSLKKSSSARVYIFLSLGPLQSSLSYLSINLHLQNHQSKEKCEKKLELDICKRRKSFHGKLENTMPFKILWTTCA